MCEWLSIDPVRYCCRHDDAVTAPSIRSTMLTDLPDYLNLNTVDLDFEALPSGKQICEEGRTLASDHPLQPGAFLLHHQVSSEAEYKREAIKAGRIQFHAQIGYRSLDDSRRAWSDIAGELQRDGLWVDRYGVCLDWSMGYPRDQRSTRPRGTGLIVECAQDLCRLTSEAPVAPHFGDFVMGTPAALENTIAALAAGATSIGNLGQYFTFRLPYWDDDTTTTVETVRAIALTAALPEQILIHSNLDDGFAALFEDLACSLGAVLIEQYVVDVLLGGSISHCYGHTFSQPHSRRAFQVALSKIANAPGTMIYGNTTRYGTDEKQNLTVMREYLANDIVAQKKNPSGHAINAVPLSEAERIPTVDEVIQAQRIAHELATDWPALTSDASQDAEEDAIAATVSTLIDGAQKFRDQTLTGLAALGVDLRDPVQLLLAIRRLGARRLEYHFGPGPVIEEPLRRRQPLIVAPPIVEIDQRAEELLASLLPSERSQLSGAGLRICVATTDVHEYGKILIERVCQKLEIDTIDGGVSVDPEDLVATLSRHDIDAIALGTYNGIALDYVCAVRNLMKVRRLVVPLFVGGRLNQIRNAEEGMLPMDVSAELNENGAIACDSPLVFFQYLLSYCMDVTDR